MSNKAEQKSFTGNPPQAQGGIQVIARAAAILRALKDNNGGMSLGQIAEKIALPRSTVQRIVSALQAERLLISSPNGGGVRLGPELLVLGGATRNNIVELCRPLLETLAGNTGETVDLSVMRHNRMIFLDQVQGQHRLRTISSVGEEFPLSTTANGRACLARLSDSEAKALAEAEWSATNSGGDFARLQKQLDEIRQSGIAYDLGDHTSGISAVGFAFTDTLGDLHAISVPIPSTRYREKSNEVVASLNELMQQLPAVISGR